MSVPVATLYSDAMFTDSDLLYSGKEIVQRSHAIYEMH